MADRDVDRQLADVGHPVVEVVHVGEELNVPAEWLQAMGERGDFGERRERVAAGIGDVDADAACALGMEVSQHLVGNVGINRDYRAHAMRKFFDT